MWLAIIITLWLLPVLAVLLPSLTRSLDAFWRRNSSSTVILIVALAAYATINVGRANAAKGGPTNPPPAAVTGRIRLYHDAGNGHLVPLDAQMKGIK